MSRERIVTRLSGIRKFTIASGTAAGITAAVLLVYLAGWLDYPSIKFLDMLFNMRGEIEASKDIVIVAIDGNFKKAYRETNAPISRKHYARLTENICNMNASVIVFDLLFLKPDWAGGDPALAQAIESCYERGSGVILASSFDTETGLEEPLTDFHTAAGLINLETDPVDETFRRIRPFMRFNRDDLYPSLGVMAVVMKQGIDPGACGAGLETDPWYWRIGDSYINEPRMMINFTGGKYHYRYVSGKDVMQNPGQLKGFEDSVVLIADTTPQSQDFYDVPFKSVSSKMREKLASASFKTVGEATMPGVEIHANVIQTLIDKSWIRPSSERNVIIWLFIAGAVTGFLFFFPKIPVWLTAITGICVIGAELGIAHILFAGCYWFDMIPVFLVTVLNFGGGILYKNVILARANKKVANMFGQYVSANIVDKILKEGIDIAVSGQTAEVTVLFSDIRGFTPISEKLSPEEIGRLLNTYFSVMIKTVFDHDGTLDKLMGDAIMAFFGDPVKFRDHPEKACTTALAMMEKLENMKNNPQVQGIEMVDIGIGLNTGPVTVGDLGSFEYRDYTVIGDNVNLGSRLEGMNKTYGTNIIASEFTHEKVKDAFDFRRLDAVRVKGKTKPVTIYELVGQKGTADQSLVEDMQRFETALDMYMKGEFEQAGTIFNELAGEGKDSPSETFAQRCREYADHPPEDWDGVYTATSK